MQKTCIIITGPTAVGKTHVAIDLAVSYKTEIISADSRQCYTELNIGVAKPHESELAAVRHHFINSHSIQESVNAAAFERYALDKLHHIFEESDVAIVCGGTGLYIKALCEGLDEIPSIPVSVRSEIATSYHAHGIEYLAAALRSSDPVFAQSGEMQNPRRMMRALEIVRATGRSIISFRRALVKPRDFEIVKFFLTLPRPELYQRIDRRVDVMMRQGLEAEVRSLLAFRNLPALQTVGYQELFEYFDGLRSLDETITLIKQHTRNYAKRQITWFRRDDKIIEIVPVAEKIRESLRG